MRMTMNGYMPDLEAIDTPPSPQIQADLAYAQSQVDQAYVQFLEARKASLERAIGEALWYLDQGCGNAKGRAWEVLKQAMTS